jgi:YVTN family beta-propeller protein
MFGDPAVSKVHKWDGGTGWWQGTGPPLLEGVPMRRRGWALFGLVAVVAGCSSSGGKQAVDATTTTTGAQATTTTLPPRTNIYAAAGATGLNAALANVPTRVYVPNSLSGTVSVIDPATFKVIDTFPTGPTPQHVVPSWDLTTLWVNNNGGSLTPIDPKTGKPGTTVPIDDPYNMYFTPDGKSMIIVAEARQRLDFLDPKTLKAQSSLDVPCPGVNHIDYAADGSYFIATCEFGGALIKVATGSRTVVGRLTLGPAGQSMPQDVRLTPDGRFFYVADMVADGLHVIDGEKFEKVGFIPTGPGAHGIYPSRDGTRMYAINRGSHSTGGQLKGPGSISVVDYAAGPLGTVVANWPVPGGGSPDMGNLSADGKQLWLGGRYDSEVYCFDTTTGQLLARVAVGQGPHGITIWPQPGRYSLGHTGNMR